MPGHQVGEEPDGQRERPHDERRDQFDHADEGLQRGRDTRRPCDVAHVVPALMTESRRHEDDPGQDGERRRHHPHPRGEREVDERSDLEEVAHQDEEEHREQPREVLQTVLGADDADGDLVPHETDEGLDEGAELAGHQPRLVPDDPEVEDPDHDQRRHDREGHRPVPEPEERELEEQVHALGNADDFVLGITLGRSEDQLFHSNSLSAPLATASASQLKRTRYPTIAEIPKATLSISNTAATANIVAMMRPRRRKNPNRAAA